MATKMEPVSYKKRHGVDLTGQVIEKLTVVRWISKTAEEEGVKKGKWECLCECGNICYYSTTDLMNKTVKSCGCHKAKYMHVDLVGQVFDYLTPIEKAHENNTYGFICECKCGNTLFVPTYELIKGIKKSCGCKHTDVLIERNYRHGMTNTRLYRVWANMIKRTENENEPSYKDYGARGIKVCEEWHDFVVFMEWALEHGYTDELTIERIDVDGNYCPDNCRWATRKEQGYNKRNSVKLEYNGEVLTQSQLAERLGTDPKTIFGRIKRGWSIEEIFTTPVAQGGERKKIKVVYNGEDCNLIDLCREYNIYIGTVQYRLNKGMDLEEALTKPVRKPKNKTKEAV